MNRYYDSCVFGNASNACHPDYEGCVYVTSVENIDWSVSACPEVVLSELPSVEEFFDNFFVYCQTSGINFSHIAMSDLKKSAKAHRAHKKPLLAFGFNGNDWNHLMAAVFAQSNQILTTDEDFFDPSNKAAIGAKRRLDRVSRYIREEFSIAVLRPQVP